MTIQLDNYSQNIMMSEIPQLFNALNKLQCLWWPVSPLSHSLPLLSGINGSQDPLPVTLLADEHHHLHQVRVEVHQPGPLGQSLRIKHSVL